MKRQLVLNGTTYTGRTFSTPVKQETFGLEKHGIKLEKFVTNYQRGDSAKTKEYYYKDWIAKVNRKGVYVPLWKGKGKVTTVQPQ